MILFILQNAYTSDKHPFTNEEEWGRELLRSQTGRRLKEMIPDGVEYKVINASPKIGADPDSLFKADFEHISKNIGKIRPTVIVACGVVAQAACECMGIKCIKVPHPAWRQLSKQITRNIMLELQERN